MVGTVDVQRWWGWASGVADNGQARVSRLTADLASQGRRTTNELFGEVQRRVQGLRLSTGERAAIRSEDLRSIVDELALLNRHAYAELREAMRDAALQQLSALGAVTKSVAEAAAEQRRTAAEVRMMIDDVSDRQRRSLALIANVVEQIAAVGARSNNELVEELRHTSETLHEALAIQNRSGTQLGPQPS